MRPVCGQWPARPPPARAPHWPRHRRAAHADAPPWAAHRAQRGRCVRCCAKRRAGWHRCRQRGRESVCRPPRRAASPPCRRRWGGRSRVRRRPWLAGQKPGRSTPPQRQAEPDWSTPSSRSTSPAPDRRATLQAAEGTVVRKRSGVADGTWQTAARDLVGRAARSSLGGNASQSSGRRSRRRTAVAPWRQSRTTIGRLDESSDAVPLTLRPARFERAVCQPDCKAANPHRRDSDRRSLRSGRCLHRAATTASLDPGVCLALANH